MVWGWQGWRRLDPGLASHPRRGSQSVPGYLDPQPCLGVGVGAHLLPFVAQRLVRLLREAFDGVSVRVKEGKPTIGRQSCGIKYSGNEDLPVPVCPTE